MKNSIPFRIKIYYSLGQLGWSLLSGLIATWLVWFYMPPEESGISILYIPQKTIIWSLSIIGIITALSRLIDAITDPLIANLSDRYSGKLGRRITFMKRGSIPFALFTVLVFIMPVETISIFNVLWLALALFSFYIAFTIYVTPYFALLSELGTSAKDKLDLSTFISFTFFFGTIIASGAPYIWAIFEDYGFSKISSIRITISILSFVALIFLLIPVVTIDEKRYVKSTPANINMVKALIATFRNKDFIIFTISDLAYWISMTMFQTGTVYFATVLLDYKEDAVFLVTASAGLFSFFLYPVVNIVAKRFGKKIILGFAFIPLIIGYSLCGSLGLIPLSDFAQIGLVVISIGIALAIFGILPNAIIADIAEYDHIKTNVSKEAMFFGTRTFMSKLGQMIAMFALTSFLTLGNSSDNPTGIRFAAFFCVGIAMLSFLIFLFYNEKRILSITESDL
ncbi:MFS transporter [Haloplasma contractile]|uniref:Symporter protein n=1 Tax=Haloplasma contractile SSD-17B TaxID=1033810 RepID=F7PWP7_9MOLU|nr:MFS transporter [Haloplasma contractile]ERJ12578.1 putative symporter protein [Haloplasma contractile SSD-17B]